MPQARRTEPRNMRLPVYGKSIYRIGLLPYFLSFLRCAPRKLHAGSMFPPPAQSRSKMYTRRSSVL